MAPIWSYIHTRAERVRAVIAHPAAARSWILFEARNSARPYTHVGARLVLAGVFWCSLVFIGVRLVLVGALGVWVDNHIARATTLCSLGVRLVFAWCSLGVRWCSLGARLMLSWCSRVFAGVRGF